MLNYMDEIKTISTPIYTNKIIKTEKIKKPRVITQEDTWVLQKEDYDPKYQYEIMFDNKTTQSNITIHKKDYEYCDYIRKLTQQQITKKISGYRAQDIDKKIFNIDEFIDYDTVLQLLQDCHMLCFYCKDMVSVLYELVREPKQWSLDRINNDYGHNKNNVVIACLQCNLKRRCILHERFVFTKQLNIVKHGQVPLGPTTKSTS